MHTNRATGAICSTLLICGVLGACAPQWSFELDKVARSIDDWGTVTISGATLIDPDPSFQFDLQLTGNQIFERNRIEGFSNVSQFDATDAQISVLAELVANTMDQIDTAAEPGLRERLRKTLMAAAFKGLVDALPEDQQPLLDELLRAPLSPNGGSESAAEDGGAKLLAEAHTRRDEAAAALAAGKEAYKAAEQEADLEQKNLLAGGAEENARTALAGAAAVAELASRVGQEAVALVEESEAQLSRAPENSGLRSPQALDLIQAAKDAGQKARGEAQGLRDALNGAKFEDSITAAGAPMDRAKKALEIASAFLAPNASSGTVTAAVAAATAATNQARQVAVMCGVPVTSGKSSQPRVLSAPEIDIEKRLALKRLPGFRDRLPNYAGPLDLNLRQLLILSASDKMTLEMLRWLSYPRGYAPGKRVYLCMASVNVTPGRRTYRGYAGSVDLMMEYIGIREDNKRMNMTSAHPIVFAAHPFIDTQALDLRTARRQSFSMAVQLILNGYPAAGRALLDYARLREQDVQTVSGLNTMTSYTTGRHIGFTFAPRLVAQADPSNYNSGPSMVLQAQTVPVLLMIICDEDQLRHVADLGYQPHLQWRQTHAWRRLGSPTADALPFGEAIDKLLFTPRLTEMEMAERAQALDRAGVELERLRSSAPQEFNMQRASAQFALRNAEQQLELAESALARHRQHLERLYAKRRSLDPARVPRGTAQMIEAAEKATPTLLERVGKAQRAVLERRSALALASGSEPSLPDDRYYEKALLRNRYNSLGSVGVTTEVFFGLPYFRSGPDQLPESVVVTVSPEHGWINRPSTFFVTAGEPIFTNDYLVSVGGRQVNATRISDLVLKITVPPWLDTFDYEDAFRLHDDKRLSADVAVAVGPRTYLAKTTAGDASVTFRYYAPTPRTAATSRPAVDLATGPPEARFEAGNPTLQRGQASHAQLLLPVLLSQTVTPSQARLVLHGDGNATSALAAVVHGRRVELQKPLDISGVAPDSLLQPRIVTLELTFSDRSTMSIVVDGKLTLVK